MELTDHPKRGIGIVAKAEIIKGRTDEEALAEVIRTFPDAHTTIQCIESYRSRLRSSGYHNIPTSAAARRGPRLCLVA